MKPVTPKSGVQGEDFNHSDAERNARQETIRIDVARRLRKACSHLGEEEFAALIDRIVSVQLKTERRSWKTPS